MPSTRVRCGMLGVPDQSGSLERVIVAAEEPADFRFSHSSLHCKFEDVCHRDARAMRSAFNVFLQSLRSSHRRSRSPAHMGNALVRSLQSCADASEGRIGKDCILVTLNPRHANDEPFVKIKFIGADVNHDRCGYSSWLIFPPNVRPPAIIEGSTRRWVHKDFEWTQGFRLDSRSSGPGRNRQLHHRCDGNFI
jgi:hypothetical protein